MIARCSRDDAACATLLRAADSRFASGDEGDCHDVADNDGRTTSNAKRGSDRQNRGLRAVYRPSVVERALASAMRSSRAASLSGVYTADAWFEACSRNRCSFGGSCCLRSMLLRA